MDDSVIFIGIMTLIDFLPDLVGDTIEEYQKRRSLKKLETSNRRKEIRNRVKAAPEKFIGKSLQELNLLGIDINQNQFNQKISQAVQDLTSSKRNCIEYKL